MGVNRNRLRVGDVLPNGRIVLKVQRHPIHKGLEAFVGDPRRRDPIVVTVTARPRPDTVGSDLAAAGLYWFRRAGENFEYAQRARSKRVRDLWMDLNRRQMTWSKRLSKLARKSCPRSNKM